MKIKFLEAYNGDSILLSFKEGAIPRNILIDGGMAATYSKKNKKGKIEYGQLRDTIDKLKVSNEKIDLLILTHVDDDHIGGILNWFENDSEALDIIGKVWFNSGRIIKKYFEKDQTLGYDNSLAFSYNETTNTSISQGVKFEDFIESKSGLWDKKLIISGEQINCFGLTFDFLSPNEAKLKYLLKKWEKEEPESLETGAQKDDYNISLKEHIENDISCQEDDSIHNGSSIGFMLTYEEKKMLFLGDAHPSVLIDSIKRKFNTPLNCVMVKLSHHGSKYNNSKELLVILNSKKYIISTNGDKHSHPHKCLIARLVNIKKDCEIYFNYPELISHIFSGEDYKDFPNFKSLSMTNNEFHI